MPPQRKERQMSAAPNETSAADQALTRAAGMVATAKVDFDRRAVALNDQIAGMAMRWQGSGGLAFQNLQRAWQEKQTTIMRALDDFEQSLVVTDRDFTSTDDAQAQVAGTNLGRLDGVSTSI
jgi:WXG100 family type VII secretion target